MKKHIWVIIMALVLVGCENKQRNTVPSYPVYMDLNILGEFPHFVPDNGFQTMTFTSRRFETEAIGYSGVLVWVDMQGRYQAADLCCPVCLKRDIPVETDGIFACCPECGERYDLSYGYAVPTQGVSRHALRKFKVSAQGAHLIIRN